MALKDKIRVRRDTTANFTSTNPVLSLGEISFDTTTKQFKVGDGSSTWISLTYADAAATAAAIAAYAQPLDSDLTAIAGLGTHPFGRSLLTHENFTTALVALGVNSNQTTDPGVVGRLWNDNSFLRFSAGFVVLSGAWNDTGNWIDSFTWSDT
jgi:hypothetical protein